MRQNDLNGIYMHIGEIKNKVNPIKFGIDICYIFVPATQSYQFIYLLALF